MTGLKLSKAQAEALKKLAGGWKLYYLRHRHQWGASATTRKGQPQAATIDFLKSRELVALVPLSLWASRVILSEKGREWTKQ